MKVTVQDKKNVDGFLQKVMRLIDDNHMLEKGDGVLVGLSGGADSVCLFTTLLLLKDVYDLKIIAIHLNHQIRGEEALRDQRFVEELAKENGVECIVVNRDIKALAKENHISEEEAGRMARYQVFANTLVDKQFQKVAVAHNANDQAETVLFHLARGTGLRGLSGIAPVRDGIIRPLLCMSRKDIEQFLGKIGQEYCEDSTNATNQYTRNQLRHDVLPVLEREINPASISHIGATAEGLREIERYLENVTLKHYQEIVEQKEHRLRVSVSALKELDIAIQKRILRRMLEEVVGKLKDIQTSHIQMLLSLCDMETGKQISLPYKITAEKEYDYLVINGEDYSLNLMGNNSMTMVSGEKGRLVLKEQGFALQYQIIPIEELDKELKADSDTKCFDYNKIKTAVFLRKPLSSDYLHINTDGNSKKLRRYFIDEKIPRIERENTIVLAEGNHVLWVCGRKRVSAKYMVSENTKRVLVCTYEPLERN